MKIFLILGLIVAAAIALSTSSGPDKKPATNANLKTLNQSSSIEQELPYFSDEDFTEEEEADFDLPTFNGYVCTQDCSGHSAGYDWAEEKGITQDDVDNYSGNSESFREGMQSYVEEQDFYSENDDYGDYEP